MTRLLPLALLPLMSLAANYTAQRIEVDGIPVVRLADARHRLEASIVPSLGNNAYELKANGKNVMWTPYASLREFQAKPVLLGNPLLAPWANRIQGDAYHANGKRYLLNADLGNLRRDGNKNPIHGLVLYAPWEVLSVTADDRRAEVVSCLELWRHPDWMAQFPFAHTIQMTYRLQDGALEVETAVQNLSADPMPLSLGYHPYFRLHDAPRDEWKVRMPVKERVVLSPQLIPTGERQPMPYATPQPLAGISLDDVFSGLTPDATGRTEFVLEGRAEKLSVIYGPKYPVAVIYSPQGRDFLCFEPMTGPTNAFNLHHAGTWKDLQTVAPGATWRESYWIKPTGF